ncbi:AraC-like DNA-binding protein [Nonomuraea thailandensis]|uniref:AraC-like DNA-binding protein n=1 Tax=Nonomuraea thailandensis TaxID=1188745 RepID=A0A9X2GBZ7_9ACTN|nr:helix-turn-helix domain-containing protein [Nonomuraea thailandensis]MCP2356147.1 AraC-like DNA-binding protein [Nonomuraea thailandensis]
MGADDTGPELRGHGGWEVAAPTAAHAVPGVRMAGFRDRSGGTFEERVPPGPAIAIVIDCTPGSLEPFSSGAVEGGLVAGIAPTAVRMSGRAIDCVELQVDLTAAPGLLGVPPAELNGAPLDLAGIWGRDAVRLREQLIGTRSWDDRFALVRDALARRRRSGARIDPEVADAWRRIRDGHGRVLIGGLPALYGWSRTRFWSRFKSQIGVSPKRAATIVRFDLALSRLGTAASLAEVAAELGYADQSHLHREVLRFAGRTPGAIAADPLWTVDSVAWTRARAA